MDHNYDMNVMKNEYPTVVKAPDFSLDSVQSEMMKQMERLDSLTGNLEVRLSRFLRPDNRAVPSSTGIDMPSDISSIAHFIGSRAETLRLLNNSLESIIGRIDS